MAGGLNERAVTLAQVFTPPLLNAGMVRITLSVASASGALPANPNDPGRKCGVVMLFSDVACQIRFSAGAGTAVTTDFPLPANTLIPLGVPATADTISAIAAAAGTLVVTPISG